ncbi:MAG: hypothetical protein WD872_17880 [Pirellulaceae bacterium]
MSVAELMPSLQSLERAEKFQLIQWLAADLASEERALPESEFVLPPEDQCPYTPAELARMYSNRSGGRPLSEIWRSLGRT